MGRRKTDEELKSMLSEAAKLVKVGGRYRHSKSGGEYIVTDLVLVEATENVGVVYSAEYGERFRWLRSVDDFVAEVEIDGVRRKRFELMEEAK
jgi:hypothetical protein